MKLNYTADELYQHILKISTEFYELIYKDPWFKLIFRNIDQEIITSQQTDFMVQSMGGPKKFCGRLPKDAHPHIWADENIWEYREHLLQQAFKNINAPKDIQNLWLRIDTAFKNVILNKAGPEECEKRYTNDEIIYEPIPNHLKKESA